jgi:hypothetical protein
LIDKYLNNPNETESIDKIKSLLDNYTIENKKELIEITRLNYIVNMNSQAITLKLLFFYFSFFFKINKIFFLK